MQEQDLFKGYEIKTWDLSPRIYKILAASAVLNIVALLGFAQSNLLTTKGCESPLVGKVCQVIDTLVVGGSILTTDTAYTTGPYDPTVIPDDAEIIWVDQTGVEKFQYPADYAGFNRPDPAIQEIPNADGTFPSYIPGMTPGGSKSGGTNDLLSKPQELPKSNDNAVIGQLPTSPFGDDNPTRPGKGPKPRPYKTPKNTDRTLSNTSPNELPNVDEDPTPTPDPKKTVAEVDLNKQPLRDFAKIVQTRFEKKEVDLSQNFKVVAEGYLTKDGKLDVTPDPKTKKPRFQVTGAEGNEPMVQVVREAIAAVGDSGWLGYLRTQGIDKIKFMVVQDDNNLQVIITSDFPSPERAGTATSGLNGLIQGAILADKNGWKTLGADEKMLLTSAQASVNPENKKQFVLNFVMPKAVAQEMIQRKLKEAQENPTEEKPSGSTAQMKDSNQKSGK